MTSCEVGQWRAFRTWLGCGSTYCPGHQQVWDVAGRRWWQLFASESNGDWVQIQTPSTLQDWYRQIPTSTVLGSPPQRLGRVSIYRSFIQAWMHSQRVNKRKAEGSNIYHRIWLFLGPSPNSLTVNIRLLLAVFPYWVTGARFSSGVRHLNSVIYVYLAKCQQISLLSFWSTEVCQCSQQSLERYSAPILNPARIYLVPGRHLPWSAV